MFEGLVKHLNTQKVEADGLRKTASLAVKAAMGAEEEVSSRLRSCLADERAQSAFERQNMLSQITELVNKTGQVADTRWQSKINAVCNELSTSTSNLQNANINYNGSMDIWSQKEQALVDEVLKSRDTLKAKMKQDWTVSLRSPYPKHTLICFFSRLLTNTIPQFKQPQSRYTKKLFVSSTRR